MTHEPTSSRQPGNSILLIDLENFYLAREQTAGTYRASELANDLEELSRFLGDLAGPRRITVRRAYANYNAARQACEVGRWDFFLQRAPKTLMECGIEPVQVFRFPGGGNKNASDMRLAMDASVLVAENKNIEQCVLVTGDADFIPLILDLRRRGIEVIVIGVRGHTKMVLERYCDRFEYFEDLLVASEFDGGDAPLLAKLRSALHAILERNSPLPFAAVKPLLVKELGRAFEPTRFGSENTAEFLRSFAAELAIEVSGGVNDWEVRPRGACGQIDTPAPSVEPPSDSATTNEVELMPTAAVTAAPTPSLPTSASAANSHAPSDHTAAAYHKLLRYHRPNLHILPREEWEAITHAIYSLAADEQHVPRETEHQKLLDGATAMLEPRGFQMTYHKVNGVLFQIFKSGCFVCLGEGPEKGRNDFHWGLAARLVDEITSLDVLRMRVRRFQVEALRERLDSVGVTTPIDVAVLGELLDGPAARPEVVATLALLVKNCSRSSPRNREMSATSSDAE